MTDGSNAIDRIVVAGGGVVGWTAAAAIRMRIPGATVTIVAVPPSAEALADRIGSTLPSAVAFHSDIGLNEADLLARTGSGFRLGTLYEDWAEDLPPYLHSYGEHGRSLGPGAFHHHWLRARRSGAVPSFGSLSPAAAMALAGRFVHPSDDPASPLSTFEYGLQLNLPRYRDYMRAYALHLGVVERAASIRGADLRTKDGFVDRLLLDDGSEVRGDLYIDCTGPAAIVHSTLDPSFEDWGHWLACDRILIGDAAAPRDLPPFGKSIAIAAGWRWEATSPAGTSHGLVYASEHLSDSKAERLFRSNSAAAAAEAPVKIRQGRRPHAWLRNCVAIGDAAVAVEPLESVNLHLVHSELDRLIAMLPDRDFAPVELAEYNRQSAAEADRVRDFLVLHYLTARRSKHDFWRAAASAAPPQSLAHTLELFRDRGTLPFYEEETFPRDSWLAVLIGQGVMPRRTDPVAEAVPAAAAGRAIAGMNERIAEIVANLPPHSAYLQRLFARVSDE